MQPQDHASIYRQVIDAISRNDATALDQFHAEGGMPLKARALQKERQSVRREDDLDRVRNLERQIAQVDAEIDQRVYALYGLTEEEIKIVEGSCPPSRPSPIRRSRIGEGEYSVLMKTLILVQCSVISLLKSVFDFGGDAQRAEGV
jgi:hypothetical protein